MGILEPAWELFRRLRGRSLSFTDARRIVTARELGLDPPAAFHQRSARLATRIR